MSLDFPHQSVMLITSDRGTQGRGEESRGSIARRLMGDAVVGDLLRSLGATEGSTRALAAVPLSSLEISSFSPSDDDGSRSMVS